MEPTRPRSWIVVLAASLSLAAAIFYFLTPSPVEPPPSRSALALPDTDPQQAEKPQTISETLTAAQPGEPGATDNQRSVDWLGAKLHSPHMIRGEALLTFRNREALENFKRQAAAHGFELLDTLPQFNVARVRYGSLEQLHDEIANSGGAFANVEGNPVLSIPPLPPRPDDKNQGGTSAFGGTTMSALNASGDRSHWGDRVTVAVLDTGVLPHPTFQKDQVTHLDLVEDGLPFNSHGTSVASLIAGQNPQAPGLAPGAHILDIRVANADGYAAGSDLARGIITATDRGAQIINISLGSYGESALLSQAVLYASQHGAVVVAAAGNDAYNQLSIPAAYESVISVGSVDANGRQAYFSNSGRGLDMVAPGVGLITAWQTDKLASASGTSQSSALVSGAAAAYLGWGVSSANLANRLKADACPTGSSTTQFGAGILQIKPPAN